MAPRRTKPVQEVPQDLGSEVASFGDPSREFASVTLEMNDLQAVNGRLLQGMVFGSDTAPEAVRHILKRNGRMPELTEMSIIMAASEVAAMLVIPPHSQDPRTYAVIDMAAWKEVLEDPTRGNGTVLETTAVFVAYMTEVIRGNKASGRPDYHIGGWLSE